MVNMKGKPNKELEDLHQKAYEEYEQIGEELALRRDIKAKKVVVKYLKDAPDESFEVSLSKSERQHDPPIYKVCVSIGGMLAERIYEEVESEDNE